MSIRYSDFVKEKVHEIHKEVLDYLFHRELGEEAEDEFWKLSNTVNRNHIAVPEIVYQVANTFINQYLMEDLYEEEYSKNKSANFDLSEFEEAEVNCPNSEEDQHDRAYKLQKMYDKIAEKYIRPILLEEEY